MEEINELTEMVRCGRIEYPTLLLRLEVAVQSVPELATLINLIADPSRRPKFIQHKTSAG